MVQASPAFCQAVEVCTLIAGSQIVRFTSGGLRPDAYVRMLTSGPQVTLTSGAGHGGRLQHHVGDHKLIALS
jgi:hypothetical protein